MSNTKIVKKGTFPNNIRREMSKFNKSQDNVAYKANIPRSTFVPLLNGQIELKKTWAQRIARIIGCNETDLYCTVQNEIVSTVENIDTVDTPTVENSMNGVWNLVNSDIEILIELCLRENHFMKTTGRQGASNNLEIIIAKLLQQLNGSVTYTKPEVNQPKVVPLKRRNKPQYSSVKKLSRPWTIDELADVLSALRCGMSNADVAETTNRPLSDITSTKVVFGWLWHSGRPTSPSTTEMRKVIANLNKGTWSNRIEMVGA